MVRSVMRIGRVSWSSLAALAVLSQAYPASAQGSIVELGYAAEEHAGPTLTPKFAINDFLEVTGRWVYGGTAAAYLHTDATYDAADATLAVATPSALNAYVPIAAIGTDINADSRFVGTTRATNAEYVFSG
jgi:hypothetical protein